MAGIRIDYRYYRITNNKQRGSMRNYLAICIMLVLAGCSSNLDTRPVSGVSKSTKSYTVKGRSYTPQSHYGYEETGKASWYGPGFHGKKMANGERFNMHCKHTAAHKTLPLPSVAQVTDLKTGRSIKVVISDRGPFKPGRIIDLSSGAASSLGVKSRGIAAVSVRALPEESRALSNYLKRHGRRGYDRRGRSWSQVYLQEIAGKAHQYQEAPRPKVKAIPYKPSGKLKVKLKQLSYRQPAAPVRARQSLERMLHEAVYKVPQAKPVLRVNRTIKVDTYRQPEEAQNLAGQLATMGRVVIREANAPTGTRYEVFLGPIKDEKTASDILTTLINIGHYDAKYVK